MQKKEILSIGDVAKDSGLSVSTLRFYEEKGLIKSVGRKGLHRLFEANVLERLALISLGRRADFSLDEIIAMFNESENVSINREVLLNKADELDRKIKHLVAVRDTLQHVANCPKTNQLDCDKFQALLQAVNESPRMNQKKNNLIPSPTHPRPLS